MGKRLLQIIILTIGIFWIVFTQNLFAKPLELVTLQYPPYEYNENGEIRGIAVDIVKEVFKRMGQPISIKLYPWARALQMVKTGRADAIFTAFKNPEREKFAIYSNEVLILQTVSLFTLKHKNFILDENLSNITNYKTGIVHKVSYGKIFDAAIKDKRINKTIKFYTGELNFKRLLTGDLDFTVSNTYGGIYILNNNSVIDKVTILSPPIEEIPSHIAFSKKRNLLEVRDKFDKILSGMKTDGTYNKITKLYASFLSKRDR